MEYLPITVSYQIFTNKYFTCFCLNKTSKISAKIAYVNALSLGTNNYKKET